LHSLKGATRAAHQRFCSKTHHTARQQNMPKSQCVRISGRDVYFVTGTKAQTVNICDQSQIKGRYEWKLRFPAERMLPVESLRKCADIEELVKILTDTYAGTIEQSPAGDTVHAGRSTHSGKTSLERVALRAPSSDEAWIQRAKVVTELCINELVLEFLDFPYLHRVEHSLHARLYELLRNHPHFDRHFPLANGEAFTQPIHKEWPETKPRSGKNGRGNFDLAILAPKQLNDTTLKAFSSGLPDAAIVVEMGLKYDAGHLSQDADKLLDSNVQHGYLVHLVRGKPHENAVDLTLKRVRETSTIKVAYARVDRGQRFVKLLDDDTITEV
jgi:hypothetical protein